MTTHTDTRSNRTSFSWNKKLAELAKELAEDLKRVRASYDRNAENSNS